jgi:uncharacterized protein YrrD
LNHIKQQRFIMTSPGSVHPVDFLIGRTVLSRATANRIGQTHDLIVDPVKGGLSGLAVQTPGAGLCLIAFEEIYSFGPDAIMVESDESAVPAATSPLKELPLAKHVLMGTKVITEGGKVLGQIANVIIHLSQEPLFIYEVRASILDKLLGHTLFFPASLGSALSQDAERLVVSNDAAETADHTLDALTARLFGPPKEEDPLVIVRSRGH